MAHFFGTLACTDPRTLADACRAAEPPVPTDPWFGRAGTYRCPLGRRHGSAHFLLRKRDLDALDTAADHALTFEDDAGNRVSFARLTLVKAVCVTPGHEDGPLAAFECEAADRRMHLARIPIDKGYNVKTTDGGDYQAQTKNAGSAWTWTTLVNDLCTTLGITIPSVPFTPHGTPENLTYYGSFAWAALCDVADRLACAVKYDPVADSFSLVRLGDVAAAADAALARLKRDGLRTWDAYPVEPERGRRPQKVRVRFRRFPLPTDGSSPWYTVDVTLPTAAGVVAGTYAQFDDDSAALGATGTPSNSATLATRAQERADDWARKQRGFDDRFLVEYRDFQPSGVTILGPTVGEVGFDDKGGPMRTVVRAQPDGAVERFHPLSGLPLPWPPVGTSGGWHARITTASGGKWKYYPLTLDSSGNEVDDGAESAGFTATPLTIDGTNLCNPVAGDRVWMWPSKQSGKQEFIPLGYATGSFPGLISITDQTKQGNWTVTRTGSTTVGNAATLTAGAASDTYGVVQCLSTNGIFRTGTSASAATDFWMTNGYDPVASSVSAGPKIVTTSINGYVRVNDTKLGDNFLQFRISGNTSGASGDVSGNFVVGVPDTLSLILAPSPFGGGEVVQYAIKDSGGSVRSGIWSTINFQDNLGLNHTVTVSGGIITGWSIA